MCWRNGIHVRKGHSCIFFYKPISKHMYSFLIHRIKFIFNQSLWYRRWVNSMVPGSVNNAFLAAFTHVFNRFSVFVAFLATISGVQKSWKPKRRLFGNIFEQTYPVFAIVGILLAQEQICTTRFVSRHFFIQFFFFTFFFLIIC